MSTSVEINETHANENKGDSELASATESATIIAETHREWEKLLMKPA